MNLTTLIKYKNVIIAFVVAALIVFGIMQYQRAADFKTQLALTEQNLRASNDSLHLTKDRLGNVEYDKSVFVAKIKDLQKLNSDLATEVKNTKGNVATIAKAEVKVENKPAPLVVQTDLKDSSINSSFSLDSTYSTGNYTHISGQLHYDFKSKISTGTLTKNEFGLSLVTGIKGLKEGKPEIFIRSPYPGFTVTSLEGAILDPTLFEKPKQKRLSFGLNLSFSPLAYNISSKAITAVPQVTFGAGISYRIF